MMFSIFGLCVAVSLLCGLSEQSSCSDYKFTPVQWRSPLGIPLPIALVGPWYLIYTLDDGLPYHGYNCIKFTNSLTDSKTLSTKEVAKNSSTNKFETSKSSMIFDGDNGEYTYKPESGPSAETTIIRTDYANYYVEASCDDTYGVYVGIFVRNKNLIWTPTLNSIYNDLESKYNIDRTTLRSVNQNDCSEYFLY